ncbi:MAG: hypothetical protein WAL81_03460 [Methanobacterium sp.]
MVSQIYKLNLEAMPVGRKWFATTLNDVGIPQITIDFFLGHSLGAVTGAYIKPNVETLKDHYLKCINALSIQDVEVKTIESPEFKELKEQYEYDSKAKAEKIALMEKQMREIEERNRERDKKLDKIFNDKNIVEEILKEQNKK